ncbi:MULTISPECIES: pyridoxal-phosphate-dependent aminotransferase family protein [Halanaerobium]|jgi:predicted phosphoserine aminotransferase|uniref:Phosphoserine aminotransferase, putative n=1 Tax=Halanaerobium kushneri TaxID=56779 RepID=A0A1N7BXS6_9FIRM|nr:MULTISPECIES: alanine--glyoxylate aminotransferase family protein [Halanaerobium]RCW52708.1 putative phosphoserine aminotransferase [Halanaerobium sp. ST460_2HS_T2]SIR56004.1 phosphoserine aminotransferase, putative [Halanaerobium kushneri]
MHEKLFTPGPTEVRAELLKELSTAQIHHRTEEFSSIYDDIQLNLKKLLYTNNPVFLFSSSSTGAMEAAVTNGVKNRCLNFVNGAFSNRWHQITKKNGVSCDKVEIPWDQAVKPELVEEKLNTGKYDAITVVLNETSTGLMNPIKEIGEVVKKFDDVLFLVDAVSGMAGTEIRVDDWGIDMCLAGVQKAFALPAGLTVASVSDDLLKRAEEVESNSYYFNLPLLHKYHLRSQTRTTPAIPQIFALQKQLDDIVNKEGIENRFARHREMAEFVQNWALEYFDIYAEEGYWSNTVTCIENNRGIDVNGLINTLVEKYNIRIANGYGDLKNKAFRIGHMGDLSLADIKGLLATIESILDL